MDIKGPVTFAMLFSPPQKILSKQTHIAPLLIGEVKGIGRRRGASKIPLDFMGLYSYNYSNMAKPRNRALETWSKTNMRKTTIELTEEQYFFLKEKALELQKQNQNASIVSIIRDLIEKDRQEWTKARKEKRGN